MSVRIGVDVGGTFTDLFLVENATGRTHRHKLPSTPRRPTEALIEGVRQILANAGFEGGDVEFLGLGTTVSTNELLERKGALTGLITTRGFRDLLEIGRQSRPHVYDLFASKPAVLVERRRRLEVTERIDFDGSVLRPVDTEEVREAAAELVRQGVKSIAICFVNAYANPENEIAAATAIRQGWPDLYVSVSHEISPEFREFERLSSVVVNSYLMPGTDTYLQEFEHQVKTLGIRQQPLFMNSAGGVMAPSLAAQRPIDTLFSGPSGGVSAARHIADQIDTPDLITFDMGGTSTDVCMIRGGEPEMTHNRSIDGVPIRATALDVHTVGAGGSSIAWIDAGGLLHVGPESAGAQPGPACYGRGGENPTVTDANIVLGRLHPQHLLGGRLQVDPALARAAIQDKIAGPKGMSVEEAAAAILELSNHNIAQAVRYVSVERGLDPQDFMLMAFGGAGPLHAAFVARELGIRRVLIPGSPGVLCAMGVLTKDVRVDSSRTRILDERSDKFLDQLRWVVDELDETAERSLTLQGYKRQAARLEYSADLRYVGQNYEINIRSAAPPSDAKAWADMRQAFHAAHKRQYGYASLDKPLQMVTVRLTAVVPIERPDNLGGAAGDAENLTEQANRRVFFAESGGFVSTPVVQRDALTQGNSVAGPAIIEQMDTTTILPPGFTASVDDHNNLIITQSEESL
ncbi:hydantoinase/oxoprolinase family protein [Oceanibaculum pacificum]|uniref:hydantoinase/oxoprolinase family protein n=1 Tax=Oceanibaculum pacificum TaxID=580166 RepID=UPI0009FE5FF9|nr:hydantoinase/oxoprolinase family protein [Oceanibaculum pacificum]